ncbi:MAG: hypothetical protein GXP36_12000 [Actinobacteria bacterium]|nr:hypothetical protein [Actinomycetota bacterium]
MGFGRQLAPALALFLVAGACTTDTGVSTSSSVVSSSTVAASTTITSVPEPVTTTSSTTTSSTSLPPPQRCVISEMSTSVQSEYWRPVTLDGVPHRLDVIGGTLAESQPSFGTDGFRGVVPFGDSLLISVNSVQAVDGESMVELFDAATGSVREVGLGDIGRALLVGVLGNVALFGGQSPETRYPVLVGYDLVTDEVVWLTDLTPDDIYPDEPDEAIPGIYSAEASPNEKYAIVRIASATGPDFDFLIAANGTFLSDLGGGAGDLYVVLNDLWDASAGWFDEGRVLYRTETGSAYLLDLFTLERETILLPDIRGYDRLWASGDGTHVIGTGKAGMALINLDDGTVVPLVSAPCDIAIGWTGWTGNDG